MESIQILQNKAAKITSDMPFYDSATEALWINGWCRLTQKRTFHRCILLWKNINGHTDFEFGFRPNSDYTIHTLSYNTRQSHNLPLPLVRKSWGLHNLSYICPIRDVKCEVTFKSNILCHQC